LILNTIGMNIMRCVSYGDCTIRFIFMRVRACV